MAILKNDKFNNGLFHVVGVSNTHITTVHMLTGYSQYTSRPMFDDMVKDRIFHTQERKVY